MVFGDLGSTLYYYNTTRARGRTKEAKSEAMIEGKATVSPWIRRRVPKTETSQPQSSSDRLISHGCDCFTYFTNPLGKQTTDTAVVPHQPRVRAECSVPPDTLGVTNVITAMKSGMCTDATI
jgi:hypothetical protein